MAYLFSRILRFNGRKKVIKRYREKEKGWGNAKSLCAHVMCMFMSMCREMVRKNKFLFDMSSVSKAFKQKVCRVLLNSLPACNTQPLCSNERESDVSYSLSLTFILKDLYFSQSQIELKRKVQWA